MSEFVFEDVQGDVQYFRLQEKRGRMMMVMNRVGAEVFSLLFGLQGEE